MNVIVSEIYRFACKLLAINSNVNDVGKIFRIINFSSRYFCDYLSVLIETVCKKPLLLVVFITITCCAILSVSVPGLKIGS